MSKQDKSLKPKDESSKKSQAQISPEQIEQLAKEVADLTDALKRERADSDNIRRNHDKQISELKTMVKASVVKDLLPVIDNLERALKHIPQDLEKNDYVKGVQGIVKQFEKTLGDMDVSRIQTVGSDFNPHEHEAVVMEEGEGDREVVSEELQSGYKLGSDHIIRPAMVKVRMEK